MARRAAYQNKYNLLMHCYKGKVGYSRTHLQGLLSKSPRTINTYMTDDIPVGLDVGRNSVQLERHMKFTHGYEIENLGGLSYYPEERKLYYHIICLGCKQAGCDMIINYS